MSDARAGKYSAALIAYGLTVSTNGWLQPFARNQPATVTIDSVRALFEGGPLYHDLWQSVLW
jgi:hypothetical protein